ncbi:outer membrane protein assembly factor BamA [Oxalobacter vibrioformis]|uniref:Outer membrane protein assembly factor BamA n=1 Tax=Oxalobacter vibrioformis TaxID=933080 RepID=A0A9E9P4W6_9BURK|nr:outer membrane protein assembly factor BamA [Oxalobacter vibrioformis]WAW10531.1 outer membrane protein assembly factor BamA [Oxalobacter vibrioformis]
MKLFFHPFSRLSFRPALFAVASFLFCAGRAFAVEPFVVKDIRVEGIQRTEAGTVFNYLPVRVGDTFTEEKATTAIRTLYASGFFKDVRIDAEGDVLVVIVEERPAVASVAFTGMKEFDKDAITKGLKDIGLGEARIYDRSMVERAEQELKRQYLAAGYYSVQISTTVTPVERNRVAINFIIDEGHVAKIRQIKIIGTKAYKESELLKYIDLTTPGWLTWYTKKDQYSKEKLAADIEKLKSFYQNEGYIEMVMDSTQVSITSDKKDIYITLNIKEGEKYTVSDIQLEGELFGREEEVYPLIELKKGKTYSGEQLTNSTKAISDYLSNFGYAFANVNPQPEIDREKKEVAFTFFIDPGKRVYVRQINIGGNTKTRDEVVRREFRQMEASWYEGEKVKISRDRVDRLGYFSEVTIETPEVPGTTDQVDVNLKVVEKPTGNLMVGAGFSQSDKLMLTTSIEQENFAGTGNTVGLEVNTSKRYKTIAVSQLTPYFTEDGVSRRYEVFYRTMRPPIINESDWKVETIGANVRFGIPFTEVDRVYLGAGFEHNKIEVDYDSPVQYTEFVKDMAGSDANSATAYGIPLTAGWTRDSRDSSLVPTKGRMQKANLEVSLLGDMKYYRASYQHQYYWPLWSGGTFALNGQLDYGEGLGGEKYPVFKNFYAGGIGTVRGYETSSLGRYQRNPYYGDREYVGGSKRVLANAELGFPFPGMGYDRTLRWFAFFDAGNVFEEDDSIKLDEIRYSAGVGITWVSPMGPLKLSLGFPLNSKDGDKTENFQFTLGTGF